VGSSPVARPGAGAAGCARPSGWRSDVCFATAGGLPAFVTRPGGAGSGAGIPCSGHIRRPA
jgi:hypothetical protein